MLKRYLGFKKWEVWQLYKCNAFIIEEMRVRKKMSLSERFDVILIVFL